MLPSLPTTTSGSLCSPDVVVTPLGVPVPVVNMGLFATSPLCTLTIFNLCAPLATQKTMIPLTTMDTVGMPSMGPATILLGWVKILYEKSPLAYLCAPMMGNGVNAPSGGAMIPALTNLFTNYAGEARPGALDAAALAALTRALRPSPEGDFEARIGAVVYRRVSVFSSCLPARIHDTLRRAHAEDTSALILDLRRCPGGDTTSAIELASDFLDEGATVATLLDAEGDDTVYRVHEARRCDLPVVLLVDRHTASAAELFAGSLKAHGRAVVIGERTYGKGSVQQLLPPVTAPGAHHVTVASVVLPDGELLEGRGVPPDVAIEGCRPPPAASDLGSPEAIAAWIAADPALALALAAIV